MDDSSSMTAMVMAALLALCLVAASLIFGCTRRDFGAPVSRPDAGTVFDAEDASLPMTVGFLLEANP